MLHEVAAQLRARTDELAAVMTAEGGKPLIENSDEVGWTAAAFDYYAEIGRDSAGRVIPPIESTQLALVVKDPLGVVGCIVPWNYRCSCSPGSWRRRSPRATPPSASRRRSRRSRRWCSRRASTPAGRRCGPARGRRRSRRRDQRRRARRLRRVHRLGRDRQEIAAACADRVARINLEMGGKDPFIVCADVGGRWLESRRAAAPGPPPERRPGLHVGRALLRDGGPLRRLRRGVPRPHRDAARRRPDRAGTDIGPMVSAPQREKVAAQVEAAVEAGAEF